MNRLGSTPTNGFNILTPGYCLVLFLGKPCSKDTKDGIDGTDGSDLGFLYNLYFLNKNISKSVNTKM